MRWLRRFLPLHGCRKAPRAKRQWIGIRRRGICAPCVPLTLSLVAKVHGLCSSAQNTLRCPPGSKEVRCRSPSRGHAAIRPTSFIVGRRSRYAALRVRPRAARSRRGHNILKKPSRWRTYPADFLKSAVKPTSSCQVERRFSLRVATGHGRLGKSERKRMGKGSSSKSASIPDPRIQDHRVTDDVVSNNVTD
jgi:hypothetical protein